MSKTVEEFVAERQNTGNIVEYLGFTRSYQPTVKYGEIFENCIPENMKWSAHAEWHNLRDTPFYVDFTLDVLNDEFVSSNFQYRFKVGDAKEKIGSLASRNDKFRFDLSDVDNTATKRVQDVRVTITLRIVYIGHPRMRNKEFIPISITPNPVSKNMLESSIFADFKFVIQGKEFRVHKNVMAAASPMLLKMLTIDMAENKEGESRIDHLEPAAFEAMIKYIYEVEAPRNVNYRDLYVAAHYFGIEALKDVCEQKVHCSLNKDNASEIFLWAYPFKELEGLKYDAWDVIKVGALDKLRIEPFETVDFEVIKSIVEKVYALQQVINSYF